MISIMYAIKALRQSRGISQRRLSDLAGVSFRTLQVIEAGGGNPTISTLDKLGVALGKPIDGISRALTDYWGRDDDSIEAISARIAQEGEASWKLWLFEWVDAFRRSPSVRLVRSPPVAATSRRLGCLMASSVETLCIEQSVETPWWCAGVPLLREPWFVSDTETLKAMALVESPAAFRKRNIFVLSNFLQRA